MLVLGNGPREAIEKLLHRLRVHVRQNKREGVVGAGLDGCEDVGEREAFVAKAWRALTALPPHVARAPLLPDPRLVLEKEAETLVFMRTLNFSEQRRGSF